MDEQTQVYQANEVTPTLMAPVPPEPKKSKTPLIIIAVLVVLGLGSWGIYAANASPGRVWQKFMSNPAAPTVYNQALTFSYQDNETAASSTDQQTNQILGMVSHIKIALDGTAYTNTTNAAHPEGTGSINYSFGSGDSSFNSKANYVVKDQDFYFNLGDNPLINSVLSAMNSNKKVTWIKINQTEMLAAASSSPSSPDVQKTIKEYQSIVQKHSGKIFADNKYIDKQTVRGVATLHYANTINKTELKAMMNELVSYGIENAATSTTDTAKSKQQAEHVISTIIDKIQITKLETWIGEKDYHLHKVAFSSNAPSLASFASMASQVSSAAADKNTDAAIDKVLNQISFNSVLNFSEEVYDFGKTSPVEAPADAFDILKALDQQKTQQQIMMQNPAIKK